MDQTFNHVLIQLYRDGNDHISEHADKTLDVLKGTNIVNVSFGALRRMRLKQKKSDNLNGIEENNIQKIELPHNSVFVLGWETNRYFLHGIKPDKRSILEKSEAETAFNGERISLTFRTIATYMSPDGCMYGQGAKSKSYPSMKDSNMNTKEDSEEERIQLYTAFSAENRLAGFDWDEYYERGFDVW
jgi:hypothetical protein